MPRWLARTLARIHALAARGAVHLTEKAQIEALALGCSPADVYEVVASLTTDEFVESLTSDVTGDRMYVFAPHLVAMTVYVKIVLRDRCVVVSFHEDKASEADV